MEKPKKDPSKFLQTFIDHHTNVAKLRIEERKTTAQAGMGDAYKTDITKYDTAAFGASKQFDQKDIKHLKSVGYSDDDIKARINELDKGALGEGLTYNKNMQERITLETLRKAQKLVIMT